MVIKFCHIAGIVTLLFLGTPLWGAQTPADPLDRLAAKVSEKAANQSIVLVLRPTTGSMAESPLAVDGIRDAVLKRLTETGLKVATSEAADGLLRDGAIASPLTVPVARSVLAAAKTDLVLCGAVYRAGDAHKVAFTLFDSHRLLAQMSVAMNAAGIASAGDITERAASAIRKDVEPAAGKMIDALREAKIEVVRLSVKSDPTGEPGTAGFEMAIYDSIAGPLADGHIAMLMRNELSSGPPESPGADAGAEAAVAVASYSRRRGGTLLKISLSSSKSQLGNFAAGLDNWDVASLPPIPPANARVLAYSDAQQGIKVGNGECWTLAAEALKSAQAKPADGYTYGRKLGKGEAILPGDVLQFTSAKFEGKSPNGGTWSMQMGFPNHTAVVRRVLGSTQYQILQQNPGPVSMGKIDFSTLTSGTWEAWRPVGK